MSNSTNAYRKLHWDSVFFGYGVASITNPPANDLEKILQSLQQEKIRLAYLFLDPENQANAQARINGLLVDKKITYIRVLADSEIYDRSPEIHSYLGKELNKKIRSLALQSGQYSRFGKDKNFTQKEYEGLYTEWIKRSLTEELAKEVFVYVEKGEELGLITIGEKNGRCDIGLLSVDEHSRGKSIGRKLMQKAFVYAKEHNYKTIQVVTQKDNKDACIFYEKLGFTCESVVNVYHFWLNSSI